MFVLHIQHSMTKRKTKKEKRLKKVRNIPFHKIIVSSIVTFPLKKISYMILSRFQYIILVRKRSNHNTTDTINRVNLTSDNHEQLGL